MPVLSQCHQLAAASSLRLYLRRGSVLQLHSGKAYLLGPPGWLADTVVREPRLLLGGDCQQLDSGGWVALYAVSAVSLEVTVQPADGTLARLGRWLALALIRAGRGLGRRAAW